jgi:hypothetical protein
MHVLVVMGEKTPEVVVVMVEAITVRADLE